MAVTPQPGWMLNPADPTGNSVIPIGSASQPQTTAPATSSYYNPNANYNAGVTPQAPTQPAQTTQSAPQPPSTGNLAPGAQGQNVEQLQQFLVEKGYLTPQQVASGPGIYGPQTTAAVAKLQKDLGINAGTGAGYFGPQTQQALAQKYQGLQKTMTGTAPDSAAAASAAINAASQTSSDPVFGAMVSSLGPIMDSLNSVLQNINNPMLTATSLQTEYQQLSQQYNLPGLQTQLMNMQNIMTGTTDDIRQEITTAGGTATESQVQAMSAARNNVILKQYNSLATQYQAAQTNVQNLMQYATTDQQTQIQRQQVTAGVVENMASIEAQMMTMGMTMQKNASDNLNKVVSNVGYTGLAAEAQNNPQMLSYYERTLGLAQGSLSDPTTLSQLETYRQQQLQLGQQKVTIQMYNAGMGQGGIQPQIVPNPTQGPSVTQNVAQTQLQRPSWLPSNVPIYMTPTQMTQAAQAGGFTQDPGTQNYVAPNIGYYMQNPDGSYYLNSALPVATAQTSVDTQYKSLISQVKQAQATPMGGSPLNKGRLSRNANTALSAYKSSPVYQNVSNGAVYLSRIAAAMTNPGSVSDLELADSIIKINNGGGQVTEAQLNTYFAGQSFADKFNIAGDKLNAKGGVLSPQQRQDLSALADETFKQYQQQYEQLYLMAGQNLEGQGIPLNYLSNLPDWSSMLTNTTL